MLLANVSIALLSAFAPAPVQAPTRANPQTLQGKMTVGEPTAEYSRPGQPHKAGKLQNVSAVYPIDVLPKTRLKVQLQGNTRLFKVVFVGEDMGRTFDPGLTVNRIMGRPDASFYENSTGQVRRIHCVLIGIEPMVDEPYTLVFTDY